MRRSLTIILCTILALLPIQVIAKVIPFGKGRMHITVMTSNAIRLQYEGNGLPQLPEYVYLPQQDHAKYTLRQKAKPSR